MRVLLSFVCITCKNYFLCLFLWHAFFCLVFFWYYLSLTRSNNRSWQYFKLWYTQSTGHMPWFISYSRSFSKQPTFELPKSRKNYQGQKLRRKSHGWERETERETTHIQTHTHTWNLFCKKINSCTAAQVCSQQNSVWLQGLQLWHTHKLTSAKWCKALMACQGPLLVHPKDAGFVWCFFFFLFFSCQRKNSVKTIT